MVSAGDKDDRVKIAGLEVAERVPIGLGRVSDQVIFRPGTRVGGTVSLISGPGRNVLRVAPDADQSMSAIRQFARQTSDEEFDWRYQPPGP